MRAKRDLFRSLTLAAMVDSASRMCRGLPLPSLEVAASYIRTYDGRDDLRAARTPKYVSFPSPVIVSFRYRFVIVSPSPRSRSRRRGSFSVGRISAAPHIGQVSIVLHSVSASPPLLPGSRRPSSPSRRRFTTAPCNLLFARRLRRSEISATAWPASVKNIRTPRYLVHLLATSHVRQ